MIEIVLGIGLIAAISAALVERRRRIRMYHVLDRMLDQILDREEIEISDIQEGELSSLAGKSIRIQEKMESEIEQAMREKEQVKSLISNMSHQLKTPLSNVMMWRELLEEQVSDEQQKVFLVKMKQQMDKIEWILQSLFKMVRLEQGAIQFEVTETSIKETLARAVNTVYERAEKKNIQIITLPFEDCRLLHNRKWTAEVFSNILENAIKYSDVNNQIEIRICPLELFTEVKIRDHGIGIEKEELTDIFKRFYRSKRVEHKEGSGIGLYLSRLILEQEKGYMTVSSEYGVGSTFSIFLQNCQNSSAKLSLE
ncbi:sensor histidine kinase [Bariatricus sp. SGI.154]|uniref:sensor histidine kinase n=1 Tax=Bariatricus sp. SGI.154 TaxID=3420549 RepID=UPI003CFDD8D6